MILFRFFILCFLISSANTENLSAQASTDSLQLQLKNTTDLEDRIALLIEIGKTFEQTNPDTMVTIIADAYRLALENELEALIIDAGLNLGMAHTRFGSYGKALETLERTLSYLNATGSDAYELQRGRLLRSYGAVFFIQYQYEQALQFLNESLPYLIAENDSLSVSKAYDNMASVYMETKNPEKAEEYYLKSLEITEALGNKQSSGFTNVNLAILYDNTDQLDKAYDYALDALALAEESNAMIMQTYALKTLSSVSRKRKDYDNALLFAQRSLDIANKLNIIYEQKDAYANLSKTYEMMGDFENAYWYFIEEKSLNDSLLNEEAANKLAELRATYETERQQQEILVLEKENEAKSARIISISIALGSVLLTVVLLTIWFAAKKRKEIQLLEKDNIIADSKKKLAEEALANSKLRAENLQKELTNYALHIVEKNDFLEEVKSEMATIKSDVRNSEAVKQINKLGSKIYQNMMINKDREEFEIQVEQACEGFFINLDRQFPTLTTQERRLAALLRLNLSSKEISGILNISPKSVDQGRYRLRKKLKLAKELNLAGFLNNI